MPAESGQAPIGTSGCGPEAGLAVMAAMPIHPFPARMAPEIALAQFTSLAPNSVVLDPMAGSGTVLRMAAEQGHRALGFDLDPLAVLMARVWTTPIDAEELRAAATELVTRAKAMQADKVVLPWIDTDRETRDFVDYWFGQEQQGDLRRLGCALFGIEGLLGDALRIALSRTIITKDRGASLARDVSHSRPHRVWERNNFAVIEGFLRSVRRLARQLEDQPPPGNVRAEVGDARRLTAVAAESIDAVVTSPPYLNAIDYLRGHRLALVWLGHRVGDLRAVRSDSIGAERRPDRKSDAAVARELCAALEPLDGLPDLERLMVERYVLDLDAVMAEVRRVLRCGGKAVLVVGNSCVRGVFVKNAAAVSAVAKRLDLRLEYEVERDLPPNRRYLPPPGVAKPSDLKKRMRTETVLTFVRQ
jgi:DNA modification methylase